MRLKFMLHINDPIDDGTEDVVVSEKEPPPHPDEPLDIRKKSPFMTTLFDFRCFLIALFLCIFFGFALPFAILALINAYVTPQQFSCDFDYYQRIPCVVGGANATKETCEAAGCCWNTDILTYNGTQAPYCFFTNPARQDYDVVSARKNTGATGNGYQLEIDLQPREDNAGAFGKPLRRIKFLIDALSDDFIRVRGVVDDSGYSGQIAEYSWPDPKPENVTSPLYGVVHSTDEERFTLAVVRRSDNTSLVLMDGGPLVLTDDYLEFTLRTPTTNVFGLGEGPHKTLKHKMNWESWQLFSRSGLTSVNGRIYYGVQPFYLCVEETGNTHGVLLDLSQPVDLTLGPSKAITVRSSGGLIDFYVFVGPRPADVIRQYHRVVGNPAFPPYWALGYHTCRANGNITISDEVVRGMYDAEIPHESDCGDALLLRSLSLPDTNSVVYEQLANISQMLADTDRKMVLHQGPQIFNHTSGSETSDAYRQGVEDNVFLRRDNSTTKYNIYVGRLEDNTAVVYPDFNSTNATDWLHRQVATLRDVLSQYNITFDGMFLIDNTPLDSTNKTITPCTNSVVTLPPVSQYLADYYAEANDTVCLTALHQDDLPHYVRHDTYGHAHLAAVSEAIDFSADPETKPTDRRKFLASQSAFIGSGGLGGHWGGQYDTTLQAMKISIVQMLEHNLYGMPLTGAPICGYRSTVPSNDYLCWSWMQLGAFYPLSFTYYGTKEQAREPIFLSKSHQTMSQDVLRLRYTLLPYFYLQFYNAYQTGEPVVRPLLYEFPADPVTWVIDYQFLWGSSLMITPSFVPDQVIVYFPAGCWYDFQTHYKVCSKTGTFRPLIASQHLVNIHIREGAVLATQLPDVTTTAARQRNFVILVALNSTSNGTSDSKGQLFLDDGETYSSAKLLVNFVANSSYFSASVSDSTLMKEEAEFSVDGLSTVVDAIIVFSVEKRPTSVTLQNGTDITSSMAYDKVTSTMYVSVNTTCNLSNLPFSMSWS